MKWLNGFGMRLMFVGLVAALVIGGGRTKADFTFREPENLGPTVNSLYAEIDPCISADGLELYFHSNRPVGYGSQDLWVTRRPSPNDAWGMPVNLGRTVNSSALDQCPYISSDGLSLFFCSNRSGGLGNGDIWVTTRPTKTGPWGSPANLGPTVNTSSNDAHPHISVDGLSLYFADVLHPGDTLTRSIGYGGGDIWVSTRQTSERMPEGYWREPTNLGTVVNSSAYDAAPCISSDGLMLFFHSSRTGGYGDHDIWVARRKTSDDPWGEPINLGPSVNTSLSDGGPAISADGKTLYFFSGEITNFDLYQASIIPIVDLNSDGIVDASDMCIVVDHWGENHSLCDIGPKPWGDGIVDIEDLKVLAEHLFEDQRLVAHWMLDETEGNIAYDSAQMNDATVLGDPVWQPQGGIIVGALAFDGIDDCIDAPFVLNPADSRFSVFAWIKGGIPGQVVVSQDNGSNLLCLDSVEGCLISELKGTGRSSSGPLLSEANVTDGTWHEIALVWDNSCRNLYVDGVEVGRDTAPLTGLEAADGGLSIGVGTDHMPGTYWLGMIDDVRIYNRAVKP